MSSKKLPVIEIINLLQKKVMTIVVIISITISASYLYNKHIKYIFYKYSLEFIALSEWEGSQIGIDSQSVNSLIRNLILVSLNDFEPTNTNVMIDGSYISISFASKKKINTENFFSNLSKEVNKNIAAVLMTKYSILQSEEKSLTDNIERIVINEKFKIDLELNKMDMELQNLQSEEKSLTNIIERIVINEKFKMDFELQNLKVERKNIKRVFYEIIENPVGNSDLVIGSQKYRIIKDYYILEKKINKLTKQISLSKNSEYINSNNSLYDNPLYASNIERLNNAKNKINELNIQIKAYKDPKLKSEYMNSNNSLHDNPSYASNIERLNVLKRKSYELKSQIETYEDPNFKSVRKIGTWSVNSNQLQPIEIILAGILFGVLLSIIYLFLISKYLRNLKI